MNNKRFNTSLPFWTLIVCLILVLTFFLIAFFTTNYYFLIGSGLSLIITLLIDTYLINLDEEENNNV